MHTEFWLENLRERHYFEDPGIDRRIKLILVFRKWNGSMDWIELAQDRDR
jgi:hypothetical protein